MAAPATTPASIAAALNTIRESAPMAERPMPRLSSAGAMKAAITDSARKSRKSAAGRFQSARAGSGRNFLTARSKAIRQMIPTPAILRATSPKRASFVESKTSLGCGGSGQDAAVVEDDPAVHDRHLDAARERPAVPGGIARLAEAGACVVAPSLIRIEDADVGRGPRRKRACGKPEDPGGAARHQVDDAREPKPALADQSLEDHGERRLEPDDSIQGEVELPVLLVVGVGGVVGCNAIERAVPQAGDDRPPVLVGAKRGIHLEACVVAGQRLVRQRKMMRGRLGR